MADDYDYDVDDTLGYDDDWLYVEDEFLLADELAETQIPDPGYSGTNYDIDLDLWDYDLYIFWDDQEYGYDEYWDYGGLGVKIGLDHTNQKRKRAVANPGTSMKRRRAEGRKPIYVDGDGDTAKYDNVLYMSRQSRAARRQGKIPNLGTATKWGFMSDWRTRFANNAGPTSSKMPSEMARAARAQDEPADVADEFDETGAEGQYMEADVEEPDGAHRGSIPDGLDPEMLKNILQQRLGEAGLSDIDERAFVGAMQSMLSGDGTADDVMGELANALLAQASDAKGGTVNGWLSQQGISLEGEQEDDASSVTTAEAAPESISRRGNVQLSSPRDSAVGRTGSAESSTPRSTKGAQGIGTSPSQKTNGSVPSQMGPPEHAEDKNLRKRKAKSQDVGGEEQGVVQPAAKRTRAAKAKTRKS